LEFLSEELPAAVARLASSRDHPQQVVAPKGNYVVAVTATAGTLPPQTISLTLIVN